MISFLIVEQSLLATTCSQFISWLRPSTSVASTIYSVLAALRDPPNHLHAHRNVTNALRRRHARRQWRAQVHLECIVLAYLSDPHSHHAGQSGQQLLGGFLRGARLFEGDGHAVLCELYLERLENGADRIGVRQPLAVGPAVVASRKEERGSLNLVIDNERAAVSRVAERPVSGALD